MALVNSSWPSVVDALLALGFTRVSLDPEGYRRGSLLAVPRAG
jgi:PP-loop superfamily ATP-utilizing enzyme